jgi:hypothetical protein
MTIVNDASLVYELPNGSIAYNLYKIHYPYRRLQNGHGFSGVVLADKETGKLQCHVCGEHHDNLSWHIRAHKISVEHYKRKYGLRKKDKLVSEKAFEKRSRVSKQYHVNHKKDFNKYLARALSARDTNKEQHLANKSVSHKGAMNSASHVNSRGICPDQINYRFDIVAQIVGKQPGVNDVLAWDRPIYSRIVHNHGSFNNYIKFRGLSSNKIGQHGNYIKDVDLIAALRKVYFVKGRICTRDFRGSGSIGSISWGTIRERFGSLRAACWAAGIDSETWQMVG